MTAVLSEPFSAIEPTVVSWLWEPYLARGKLTLLDGDPGVGKSLVAIDLAARLSRGATLPDGKPIARPHVALVLNAEDDPSDTTRPRADGAGADLDRLVYVSGPDGFALRFPADVPELEAEVRRWKADLVVIDPMMAFFPLRVAANADQSVRQALGPLAEMAARTSAAVLIVRHLTKEGLAKAVYRGCGSIGIIGSARTGLLIARHPTDPSARVLAVTKTNLAREAPSMGFRVATDGAGRSAVEWIGRVDLSADGLFQKPEATLRPREWASDWLRQELAGGPRKAADLLSAAADDGIPEATLRRAKKDTGIRSHRIADENDATVWYWSDPAAPWPEDAPFEKPFELAPLPAM